MKIRYLTLFLLFTNCPIVIGQTTFDVMISKPDTMVWAIDIIEDGSDGYLVLTQSNEFVSGPGIPIEGTLTYGNMVTHLTGSGTPDWKVDLPTSFWQNLASFESTGYTPARQIHLSEQGNWVLPYAIHLEIVPCANPLSAAFTNKAGVVSGNVSNGDVLFNNIFFGDTTCSRAKIVKSYASGSFVYLLNDDHLLNVLELIKIDLDGDVVSVVSLPPPAFIVDAVFSEQGLVILESENGNFSLRRLGLDGILLDQVSFLSPLGAYPTKMKQLENGNYLILFYIDNPVTGEINSVFSLLDGSMQQLWEKTYEEHIVDFAADSNHQIYFVNRAGLSTTNISALNADGVKVKETQFSTPDFVPQKIVVTQDKSILLMGIYWEPFNQKTATEIIKIPLDTILSAHFPSVSSDELKICPNPADAHATLQLPDGASLSGWFTVHDALGRQVLCQRLAHESTTFEVSNWPPGIYIVHVQRENGQVRSGKLIVRR
jgi:hypothetical protein